jgi:ribosomal-protein-alanine N-acetyltransferase
VPTVRYLVAEADGRVVGYAAASFVADIAELQRLAVTTTHRRTGVATAIVEAVAALGVESGADRLLLEVREGNDGAIRLYATVGFVEVDRRPRYYRDGSAALVLRRRLGSPHAYDSV